MWVCVVHVSWQPVTSWKIQGDSLPAASSLWHTPAVSHARQREPCDLVPLTLKNSQCWLSLHSIYFLSLIAHIILFHKALLASVMWFNEYGNFCNVMGLLPVSRYIPQA